MVLRRESDEVDEAADGLEAARLGLAHDHALVILDRARVRRSTPETVTAGDVSVDRSARRAFHGGEELSLSPREFDLLAFLMHVLALRRTLGDDARAPRHVVTVRGIGLRFEP